MKLKAEINGDLCEFDLGEGRHPLGRSPDSAIVIPHETVSRNHAEFEVTRSNRRLRDQDSHNGTTLNGRPVTDWVEIFCDDKIVVGSVVLRVVPDVKSKTWRPQLDAGVSIHTMLPARPRPDARQDKRIGLFDILARASKLLGATAPIGELATDVLDLVDTAFRPSHELIALIDDSLDDGLGDLRILAQRGMDSAELSHSIARLAVKRQTAVLIEDTRDDMDLCDQASILALKARTAMVAPLMDGDRVFGLLYADAAVDAPPYTADDLSAFVSLANVVAMALTQAELRLLAKEKARLDEELAHARAIMTRLIPAELPACAGYEIAAHLEPCFEVGGDLYDGFTLPGGQYALCLGDVAGKGLGAALMVSSMLPMLRGMIHDAAGLPETVQRLSELMFSLTETTRFATLFVAVLVPQTGQLTYVNAGHNPPLLVRPDGQVEQLWATGLPVALVDHAQWTAATVTLGPSDMLAIYSDGIPEAWHDEDTEYGDERLISVLQRTAGQRVAEIRSGLLDDLAGFLDGVHPSDDVALLLLRRLMNAEEAAQ